jgi:hypothetical protein
LVTPSEKLIEVWIVEEILERIPDRVLTDFFYIDTDDGRTGNRRDVCDQ